MTSFRTLIDHGDVDGLVRFVDGLTSSRGWDELFDLRMAARAAANSGRQVWPAATLADYRLALHAPAHLAARVLDDAGRFTLGPLTEVVAQHHTFDELLPHLDYGPTQAYVAHERAIRGERIDADVFPALEIPPRLGSWEPTYLLPIYRDADVETPSPDVSSSWTSQDRRDGELTSAPDVSEAFRLLIEPWTHAGAVTWSVASANSIDAAITSLAQSEARTSPLALSDALTSLVWAGASGGPNGRRRGNAAGRYNAWWLLAAITGGLDEWPPDSDDLGSRLETLTWWAWDSGQHRRGWSFGIAVHDSTIDRAWAFDAHEPSIA